MEFFQATLADASLLIAVAIVYIVLMVLCWRLIQIKRDLGLVKHDIERLTAEMQRMINSSLRLIGPFR